MRADTTSGSKVLLSKAEDVAGVLINRNNPAKHKVQLSASPARALSPTGGNWSVIDVRTSWPANVR